MKTFLVFYGYLSLSFGWIYYIVVFLSLMVAFYSYFKSKDIYKTAESYIKSLLILGSVNLFLSMVYATFKTVEWIF